jgi:hypothetical protein
MFRPSVPDDPPGLQKAFLCGKAEEAARVPPRKKFHLKGIGKQIAGMVGHSKTLAEPAVKKNAIEYWSGYKKIQQFQTAMLSMQWDKQMLEVRKNAEVMDPALKKADSDKKGKKGKAPPPPKKNAPVQVSYDVRPKIKYQALRRELKTAKAQFVVQVLNWRKDIEKFNKFREVALKRGKPLLHVTAPPRPVFMPVLSWSVMYKALTMAVDAETAMRMLGDFGDHDLPLDENGDPIEENRQVSDIQASGSIRAYTG